MGIVSAIFGGGKKVFPVHLTDDTFEEEVLRSDLPVIVDFWSPGCAPCKKLEEIVFALAKDYAGRVKVAEMNIADAPKTAGRCRVSATPTVLYFKDGQPVERVVGVRGSLYHRQTIEEVFGIAP
ncbi:MAG: thioredoxin domain-containing protein [Myxococcota bacterium]